MAIFLLLWIPWASGALPLPFRVTLNPEIQEISTGGVDENSDLQLERIPGNFESF